MNLVGSVNLFLPEESRRRKTLDRAADQRPLQGGRFLPRSLHSSAQSWDTISSHPSVKQRSQKIIRFVSPSPSWNKKS